VEPIVDALAALQVASVRVSHAAYAAPWELVLSEEREAAFVFVVQGTAEAPGIGVFEAGAFLLLAPQQFLLLRQSEAATLLHGRMAIESPWQLPRLTQVCTKHVQGLEAILQLLAMETASGGPASELLVQRLAHLMLLYSLRDFAAENSTAAWPRALSDPRIGSSIRCMQEAIERPWTVAGLAARAGMSRAVFAQRFKDLTGNSPGEFLTQQRMYRATQLLRENRKLSDVAQLIGYASDGAFHRAFRRVIGVSPGTYRRGLN
jgi:AraC-like DNA-binding protein